MFAWFLRHRRPAIPSEFTFEVDTPLHGAAYWTSVKAIARPGKIAVVEAKAESPRRARLHLENVDALALWPVPAVFDGAAGIDVFVDEARAFSGRLLPEEELTLRRGATGWTAEVHPPQESSLTA